MRPVVNGVQNLKFCTKWNFSFVSEYSIIQLQMRSKIQSVKIKFKKNVQFDTFHFIQMHAQNIKKSNYLFFGFPLIVVLIVSMLIRGKYYVALSMY